MNKCPYCGFEIKEGDVFCMNCGAALDEDFTTAVEPKKKKNHTALWIILAAVVVLIGGAAIFLLTRPELILARAAMKTADELKQDEGLSFITETLEHGSVEVNMELGDLLSGFQIPLLSEIDARAGIKIYNDAENGEHFIKVTGALGGSSALGADLWVGPEHIVLKSPTFIGRDAYGIALDDTDSRSEAEDLLRQYTGIDAGDFGDSLPALQTYYDDSKDIQKKLLTRLYTQAFKTGDVKTEKCSFDYGSGPEKTRVITLSFDRAQLIKLVDDLYEYALDEDGLKDFAGEIDKRWLNDFEDSLGTDFQLRISCYIDADGRLARVESGIEGAQLEVPSAAGLGQLGIGGYGQDGSDFGSGDNGSGNSGNGNDSGYGSGNSGRNSGDGITSLAAAIQFYDGDVTAAVSADDISAGIKYEIGRNNEKDYASRLNYSLTDGRTMDFGGECDFNWEKDSGRWELYADGGFKATGELYYDLATRTAEAVVAKLRGADFTFEPNANIIVIADDGMPEAPDFKAIESQSDVDDFVALVTDNVQGLITQFMADYMGDMLGGLTGGGEAEFPTDPSVPEDVEAETQPETETVPETEPETVPVETEPETEEESTVPLASISMAESASSAQKESKTETKAAGNKAESESKSGSGSGTNSGSGSGSSSGSSSGSGSESETVKKPDKPVSGTYYYDDGRKVSIDFSTGQYTEHVTVKAKLYPDGTYQLVYSNGFISYNDEGTYDRDASNNMTFESSTGIDAIGKYHDDYIEVTIPGYITEKLQKVD